VHFPGHESHELSKVDRVVSIGVDLESALHRCKTLKAAATTTHLVDHVLEFSLSGVLTQRSHDGTELLGGDSAISVYDWHESC
jgi:hypothetical protein